MACLAEHTHTEAHKCVQKYTHQHLKMRIFWAADQWGASPSLSAWLGRVEGSQNRNQTSLFSILDCFLSSLIPPFYFLLSDCATHKIRIIGSISTCIAGIVLCSKPSIHSHSFIAGVSICVLTYSPGAVIEGHSSSREWACLDSRPMKFSVPSGLGCFCQSSLIPLLNF